MKHLIIPSLILYFLYQREKSKKTNNNNVSYKLDNKTSVVGVRG